MPFDTETLRAEVSKAAGKFRALVRRFTVEATSDALWNLAGYEGENDADVEVFSGIGFYSRPQDSGSDPEVVVVKVGGASRHAVIVATRDESLRQSITEADLAADETIIFNSKAYVRIKADGTIEIASAGGTPLPLPTKAEFDAHVHPTGVGPSGIPSNAPIAGTAKLKAE